MAYAEAAGKSADASLRVLRTERIADLRRTIAFSNHTVFQASLDGISTV